MFTYDDVLRLHAWGCLNKAPEIPTDRLNVGFDGERMEEQPNIQLLANQLQPVCNALIDPQLDNSIENVGLVGDGSGVVKPSDLVFDYFDLGNPIERSIV